MLGHQFAYSAAPLRKVKEVQFGILSPEEVVRGARPWSFVYLLTNSFFSFLESHLGRQNRAS
jgi:hypothetical protein